MIKKKTKRKSLPPNIFDIGGLVEQSKSTFSDSLLKENLMGTVGTAGSAIGDIAGAAISNAKIADTSNIEAQNKLQANRTIGASTNDDLMSEWGSMTKVKDDFSWKDVRGGSAGQRAGNTLGALGKGAAAGATIGGPLGAIAGGVAGLGSAIAGIFTGKKKAKRKARQLNEEARKANEKALMTFENKAGNIDTQNDLNMLANYSAYGGPIDIYGGAIDYELTTDDINNQELSTMNKSRLTSLPNSFQSLPEINTFNAFAGGGGIHIKKKNRGKFTEYCGGKVTSECIARGKRSSNPVTRKRATFAANARKWNAFGGWLNTQGGDFTNGVTFINEGGSHEENPYSGIQIGVDNKGTPNLVEEGEVVFDDYVFSDRIDIPKDIKKGYKLKGKTFAKAAKSAQRESSERPNDPLSKRALQANMERIAQAQEEVKQREGAYNEGNKYPSEFAYGGNLFEKGGDTKEENNDEPFGPDEIDEDLELTYEDLRRPRQTYTRYAPIVGAGLGVLNDLFSKPDYSDSDMVLNSVGNLSTVDFSPVGNYLRYNPFDRNFYLNKLDANAGATRRAIVNTSGGNRAAAMAGLLGADYNYGNKLGDLSRQAEEYNQAQRERVEAFNRGTNQFNSEGALKAAMANKQNDELRFRGATTAAQMRRATMDRDEARRSSNITNFLQGLGDMGWENEQANWLDTLAKSGVLKLDTRGNYTGKPMSKGGRIKTKKKKGLTYG